MVDCSMSGVSIYYVVTSILLSLLQCFVYLCASDWSRVVRLLVISGALFLLFRAVASRIRLPNITDMFVSVRSFLSHDPCRQCYNVDLISANGEATINSFL